MTNKKILSLTKEELSGLEFRWLPSSSVSDEQMLKLNDLELGD